MKGYKLRTWKEPRYLVTIKYPTIYHNTGCYECEGGWNFAWKTKKLIKIGYAVRKKYMSPMEQSLEYTFTSYLNNFIYQQSILDDIKGSKGKAVTFGRNSDL